MNKEQTVIRFAEDYSELISYIGNKRFKSIFLVTGKSKHEYKDNLLMQLNDNNIEVVMFSDFSPNPDYQSIINGVKCFNKKRFDVIVALGGGSAIDVAKCIKLFSNSNIDEGDGDFLRKEPKCSDIPLIAIPTTAGSGSEATRFAVVYYKGKKQSITNIGIIPDMIMFDDSMLCSLPMYQKKCSLMDALCHAIESFWSVNSNDESKTYSKIAIGKILSNIDAYLQGDKSVNNEMQEAAYMAGKAINITETTIGHAMSYGLTSKYNISHGHAVSLCMSAIVPWIVDSVDNCIDKRGTDYFRNMLFELSRAFGVDTPHEMSYRFNEIFLKLDFENPVAEISESKRFVEGVVIERLKNTPVKTDKEIVEELYKRILCR